MLKKQAFHDKTAGANDTQRVAKSSVIRYINVACASHLGTKDESQPSDRTYRSNAGKGAAELLLAHSVDRREFLGWAPWLSREDGQLPMLPSPLWRDTNDLTVRE